MVFFLSLNIFIRVNLNKFFVWNDVLASSWTVSVDCLVSCGWLYWTVLVFSCLHITCVAGLEIRFLTFPSSAPTRPGFVVAEVSAHLAWWSAMVEIFKCFEWVDCPAFTKRVCVCVCWDAFLTLHCRQLQLCLTSLSGKSEGESTSGLFVHIHMSCWVPRNLLHLFKVLCEHLIPSFFLLHFFAQPLLGHSP